VLQSLELRTRQAAGDDLSHGELLFRLLSDEAERRDSKRLDVRLRRVSFDVPRRSRTSTDLDRDHSEVHAGRSQEIDETTSEDLPRLLVDDKANTRGESAA
jgi:hypothetical protein